MGEARNMYGERRGAYRVLVVRAEGKTPLGRPRRRWKCDNKMDLQYVRWGGGGNGLGWGSGFYFWGPYKCGKFFD